MNILCTLLVNFQVLTHSPCDNCVYKDLTNSNKISRIDKVTVENASRTCQVTYKGCLKKLIKHRSDGYYAICR